MLRDLKWEFAFLDKERVGSLPFDKGHFLFCAIHGTNSNSIWERFLSKRKNPDSRLNFEELSLILCDIFDENGDSDVDEQIDKNSK